MVANEIVNYKDLRVFYVIKTLLYKIVGSECKFLYVSGPGSSSSKVYMFKDENNKMYAVKICDINISRVSLYKEVENMNALQDYLGKYLPKIIYVGKYNNFEIMISQCFGIDNFYSSLITGKKTKQFYYDIWEKVLTQIMSMWKNSKDNNYNKKLNPRNNEARIKRIENGVFNSKYNGYIINSIKEFKVVVNGVEYMSLKEAFEEVRNITNPRFGVTCHGDPQPSNIIISDKENSWYLVDWEWSGKNHDYRLMFSHLYGWWPTRMSFLEEKPNFIVKDNKIFITYEMNNSKLIKKFQEISQEMFEKYFDISKVDADDINRFLALLYLGDIRFLDIWGREDYFPLLIGEAIKTLSYVKNNSEAINSSFSFEFRKDG